MPKFVIMGNSGSGKSTLARRLQQRHDIPCLDLDTIAWAPVTPPERRELTQSRAEIERFVAAHEGWVIEGCYADLLETALPFADQLAYMNLPVSACIDNARRRPWEAHKYSSKAAQDRNLAMLEDWIGQYHDRKDTFSASEHDRLYRAYGGDKVMYTSNDQSRGDGIGQGD